MNSTFTINDHYSIDLSLLTNENYIHMLILNKTSYRSYETIIRPSDIMNISLSIENIHKIIVKSFDSTIPDYTFNMNLFVDSLKLSFNALFDKFFTINFEICLLEKKISSDAELSFNFNKMNIKLKELEEIVTKQQIFFELKIAQQQNQIFCLENNLSNGVVNLCHESYTSCHSLINLSNKYLFPLCLSELVLTVPSGQSNLIDFEKIDHLYKLKKLKLCLANGHFSTTLAKSKSVEHLTIYQHFYNKHYFHSRAAPNANELKGLEHFPNLQHLCIEASTFANDSFVSNLKSFNHKIKKIEMINCTTHNNSELENYCRNNKIEILIK
jgi:hypothetical protein